MKTVGIRELKNSLSAYIRAAREGEIVLVTDRGEVVARLMPPETAKKDEHPFAEMARRGEARLGKPLDPTTKSDIRARRRGAALLKGETVAEILDALREDTV